MGPLALIPLLADIVPGIVGFFGGDDAEKKVKKVVGLAKQVTGIDDTHAAIQAIKENPELQIKMQELTNNLIISEMQEETKRLQAVNETMQTESKSEHWMQWSWRPANGYLFGFTLFLNYGLPPIVNMFIAAFGSAGSTHLVPGAIPEFVFIAWGAVLGVTSWHRGMQKRERDGGGGASGIMSALTQRIAGGRNGA